MHCARSDSSRERDFQATGRVSSLVLVSTLFGIKFGSIFGMMPASDHALGGSTEPIPIKHHRDDPNYMADPARRLQPS
jgi:hypothetical protein